MPQAICPNCGADLSSNVEPTFSMLWCGCGSRFEGERLDALRVGTLAESPVTRRECWSLLRRVNELERELRREQDVRNRIREAFGR